MSDTRQRAGTEPATTHHPRSGRKEATGWVGWVFFAGIIMLILGMFQAVMGLVAIFEDEYFLVTNGGLVLSVDYTAWGWIHLLIGAIVLLAGVGVMIGQTWARVVGIIVAAVSAIANLGFLAAYPIWTMMIITLDVIVIYALAVHGREVKA